MQNKLQDFIFINNLDLKNEISLHQERSRSLINSGSQLLNPYTELGEVLDDKLLFSKLMFSNGILHPKTILISQDTNSLSSLDTKKIFLKPRHGTESIDAMGFDLQKNSYEEIWAHIKRIQAYDDCICQNYIEIKSEFKVLFLDLGKAPSWSGIGIAFQDYEKELLSLSQEILDIFRDYESLKKIDMKLRIFTLDFALSSEDQIYILEGNLRPNAIYKFGIERFS
jgi:hypothetical protein